VPFGKDLVPPLMRITADLSVFFLTLSGVPVLRDGMLLHIPAGSYEVARACSGIKFLTTAALIGTLYAYIEYASWRKRLVAVVVALAVAVLANGIRAYGLVMIGHLTNMRFNHDGWHVVLGQVLFAAIMLLMFVIGHRFRDPDTAFRSAPDGMSFGATNSIGRRDWVVAVACAVALLLAGTATRPELIAAAESAAVPKIVLPEGAGDWIGPHHADGSWRPDYHNPLATVEASYVKADRRVDVYVAAYRAPPGKGGELVSHQNRLDAGMNERQFRQRDVEVVTPEGRGLARQVWIDHRTRRLASFWFVVNGQPTTSPYHVKWLEVRALLSGRLAEERIVVVSVKDDRGDVLADFLARHGGALGLTPVRRSPE
jgi:EpsI family protein